MNVVTATKSNNTITVLVNDNGVIKPIPATSSHPKWPEIVTAWTRGHFEELLDLLSLKQVVERWSKGGLSVTDQGVFYRDQQLVGVDVDRIMGYLREKISYESLANYMVRKLANPSRRAINEMYSFLEHKEMPLTPDGTIMAYKGVRKDFFSVSSGSEPLISGRRNEVGQIFFGVGEVIEMDRSYVDDDFRKHCSNGLHVGSLEYARNWARQHDGIIIVIEIDPAGVVSVPEDCNCSKLRCAKCKVLGLFDGPLPDTFTSDYSAEPVRSCPTCDSTDCDCEDTCSECGLDTADCDCEFTGPNCDCTHTDPECDEVDCHGYLQLSESPAERQQRDNEAWLYDQMKKEGSLPPLKDNEPADGYTPTPTCVGTPVEKDNMVEVSAADNAAKGQETVVHLDIRQRVVGVISEQLDRSINDIHDDQDLMRDLGADSLDTVELVMGLEAEFKINIPDERAEHAHTVGQTIALVQNLVLPPTFRHTYTPATPPSPSKIMTENLDEVLAEAEQKENVGTTYQEGYQLGLRNGVRRRKRTYRDEDENDAFGQGYCDGYRAGRKDYKQK